jgi:hypothetical protein
MSIENGREGADNPSDADQYRLAQAKRLIALANAYRRGEISLTELEEELNKAPLEPGELGGRGE